MIGGNKVAELQTKQVKANRYGVQEVSWKKETEILGFLDLSGGDSKYSSYSAKIQESTHVFVADYQELSVTAENSRLIVDGKVYDVMLIDDPMELHQHLEIYLKYTGGFSNGQ